MDYVAIYNKTGRVEFTLPPPTQRVRRETAEHVLRLLALAMPKLTIKFATHKDMLK
jgi:hypothetical protein